MTRNRSTVRTVPLYQDKVTKGTVRFVERTANGVPPFIGTLYVPKATLTTLGVQGEEWPSSITVALTL